VESTAESGHGMKSLIHALAASPMFLDRKNESSAKDNRSLPEGERSASIEKKE
jgi:hypothetical protein